MISDMNLKTVTRDAKIVNDFKDYHNANFISQVSRSQAKATTYSVCENQAFLQILQFAPHFDAVSCEVNSITIFHKTKKHICT